MSAYKTAWSVIAAEDAKMPPDISFEDRKRRIRAAYPFGQRAYWPYKAWLRAQREYLARHVPKPRYFGPAGPLFGEGEGT